MATKKPTKPAATPPAPPPAGADAVLAAAAATADGSKPAIEPQPPELAAQVKPIEAPTIDRHPPRHLHIARALPEVSEGVEYQHPDPLVILAFKDADERVMRVVMTTNGLAKRQINT